VTKTTTTQHFLGFCRGMKKWVLENQRLVLWGAGVLLPLLGVGGGGYAVAKYKDGQDPTPPVVVFSDSALQMMGKILTASQKVESALGDVKTEVADFKTQTNKRLDGVEYGQARFARVVSKSEALRRAEKQVREEEEAERRFRGAQDAPTAPDVAGPNWRPPGRF
jgi:hypothetical protein